MNPLKNKMRRIFILIPLLVLVSFFFLFKGLVFPQLTKYYKLPTPVIAYCGDGIPESGEDCYNCPEDVPECPPPPPPAPGGWETCPDCHICPNLTTCVRYKCSPSCDSPEVCQDIDTCPGDVPPGVECYNDADCFPNNCWCAGDVPCEMSCIGNQCLSDCGTSNGNGDPLPSENSPPSIQIVFTSDDRICQAVPDQTIVITAVYQDLNGASDITRAYLGFAPCWATGEAYCTNFERNLANYFGGEYRHNVGNKRVAENLFEPFRCGGGISASCPWGTVASLGGDRSNAPGTITNTNTVRSVQGNQLTVSWTLRFNGVPANTYRVYAMARDASGDYQTGVGQPGVWWWYTSFVVEECGISGRVYDSADSDTTCSNLTTKPAVGGVVVTGDLLADGAYTNTSIGDGSYSLSNILGGTYAMSAAKDGYRFEGLVCEGSNPIGSFPIPPNKTNINIGLSSKPGSWFQTKEGDVHAEGNLYSYVPDGVIATGGYFCLAGDGNTPGVVSYGSDFDFKQGVGKGDDRVSSTGWLTNTGFSRKKFNYFYQLLGSPEEDYGGGLPADSGIYYTDDLLAVDNWNVPNGQKIVVLVDNEVNINGNIDVALGGFLAIISSGKIKVAETVPQVEGVFITDKEFEVDSAGTESDIEFRGEGIFIAESFDLGRDLGDLNETIPVESFVYRPDFLINAHPELWVSSYSWQELAP